MSLKIKGIFLFGVALLALGALGFAPSPVFANETVAKAAKADPPKKSDSSEGESKKSKGDGEVSGGQFDGDPVYVHLQPLLLPLITDYGAEQIITILIDVQVKDMRVADELHTKMPRVKDAVFGSLYGGLSDGSLRIGQAMNLSKVKKRVAKALRRTVGPDKVTEVLIQSVAQRVL